MTAVVKYLDSRKSDCQDRALVEKPIIYSVHKKVGSNDYGDEIK